MVGRIPLGIHMVAITVSNLQYATPNSATRFCDTIIGGCGPCRTRYETVAYSLHCANSDLSSHPIHPGVAGTGEVGHATRRRSRAFGTP